MIIISVLLWLLINDAIETSHYPAMNISHTKKPIFKKARLKKTRCKNDHGA